ncbi:hypothetical protein [Methylosinus sp. LW4]|uniref:hypothetical protein n=1 Tax=Methylosinus sp. LW4 TaxID=136993 RepID=UPI000381CC4F|nr:hypothetical protein [Methylosinus sp. LW4]
MQKIHFRFAAGSSVLFGLFFAVSLGAQAHAAPVCRLGGGVKHVVHLQFDNVHLRRDNPNVPSDLEQMPNLLNFLAKNGVVSGNHYTGLISHTAVDLVTGMTGLYPDRNGLPVSNSYRVFDGSGHPTGSHSNFVYWTAKDATDGLPVLISDNGKTAPAPWVAFTRAGCDVGAFSVADIDFETLPGDIATVFGTSSTQYSTVVAQLASSNPKTKALPAANWLGVAVHCAQGSSRCSAGGPDVLSDEPGGYAGFSALYGASNVQPVISPSGPVKDLDGNVIADSQGNPGFPGFNPTVSQTLGFVATLLEAGVPVVYGYIAPTHDQRGISSDTSTPTFGPGEKGYVEQNKIYDDAFGKFFARLKADGIDETNTIFLVTADENDHFVGGTPTPSNCDGVTTPCAYVYPGTNKRSVGELTVNFDSTILSETGAAPSAFLVHSDSAPVVYLDGNPAPTDPLTRVFEKQIAALTWANPLPGKESQVDRLEAYVADRAEMKLLHMLTASEARNPTLTLFGAEDYFFQTTRGSLPLAPLGDCATKPTDCVFQNSGFAWNHGDVQQDIVRTWFGLAGPGLKKGGRNDAVFTDHTDLRPTLMTLVGLSDDYVHDGRVIVEAIEPHALSRTLRGESGEGYAHLARVYKQLNAPLGALGKASLAVATRAINGDDASYAAFLSILQRLTADRDALALEIKTALDGAAFQGRRLQDEQAERLAGRASRLIEAVRSLRRTHEAR